MEFTVNVYVTITQYKHLNQGIDVWAWIENPFLNEPIISIQIDKNQICEIDSDGFAYIIAGEKCMDCGKLVSKHINKM